MRTEKAAARKWVSLNLPQFKVLQEYITSITEALDALRNGENKNATYIYLGGVFHASVKQPNVCVNIRRFFKPKDPTDTGLLPSSGSL